MRLGSTSNRVHLRLRIYNQISLLILRVELSQIMRITRRYWLKRRSAFFFFDYSTRDSSAFHRLSSNFGFHRLKLQQRHQIPADLLNFGTGAISGSTFLPEWNLVSAHRFVFILVHFLRFVRLAAYQAQRNERGIFQIRYSKLRPKIASGMIILCFVPSE